MASGNHARIALEASILGEADMSKNRNIFISQLVAGFVLATGAGGLIGTAEAQTSAAKQRCTANMVSSMSSVADFCSCGIVTTGTIRAIQQRPDFPDILAATNTSCPALAAVLSDLPTQATQRRENDSENDQHGKGPEGLSGAADGSGGTSGGDTGGDTGGDDGRDDGDKGHKSDKGPKNGKGPNGGNGCMNGQQNQGNHGSKHEKDETNDQDPEGTTEEDHGKKKGEGEGEVLSMNCQPGDILIDGTMLPGSTSNG
jgi:hypothetical protein